MTTSMTPTHGDPVTPSGGVARDVDTERWLPDPSWPVPPRGWQLWAAAGSGTAQARHARRARPEDSRESRVRSDPSMHHTDDVLSEMPRLAAIEDASFTLPTRPSALTDEARFTEERVDLLADRRAPRRAPEGTVGGFAALATLLLISCLVGGVTGGLIVLGVSTLLATSAALVRGRLSLARVGGQRGAGLLLGTAVMALIVGSVAAHDRPAGTRGVQAALVPISTDSTLSSTSTVASPGSGGADGSRPGTTTETAYAAIPPTVAAPRPSQAPTAPTRADAAGTGTTPAKPATPATPAVPGGAGTPATPAKPATPATPATPGVKAAASSVVPGLGALGGVLTLSPDALSPTPAPSRTTPPTAPKTPKTPKTTTKATTVSTSSKGAKASNASNSSKAVKTSKASKASKTAAAAATPLAHRG